MIGRGWCRLDYPLQPPDAAMPREEYAVSIDAAMAIRLAFLKGDRAEARGVLPFFDAPVELLTGAAPLARRRLGPRGMPPALPQPPRREHHPFGLDRPLGKAARRPCPCRENLYSRSARLFVTLFFFDIFVGYEMCLPASRGGRQRS